MFNREKLFNAVNYLSSIKFEINENFLNYLENDGNYLLDDSNLDNSSKSNLDPIQKAIILKLLKYLNRPHFFYLFIPIGEVEFILNLFSLIIRVVN